MDDREKTRNHLNILGWFYVVFAAMALPGLFMMPLFRLLSEFMVQASDPYGGGPAPAELQALNEALELLHYCMIALVIVHLLVNILTAIGFLKRKWYGLCFANAALTCLGFPFGTILGVLSIVVLCRPEAKMEFGRGDGGAGKDPDKGQPAGTSPSGT
jgi:hypothetical protein